MSHKCEQYIAHKKRRCNFDAKPGFAFCGNHIPNALQPERRRIQCPYGYPHSCFESEVEKHKLKCPSHAHAMRIKAQPYVQHDANAGPARDIAHLNCERDATASSGQASDRSAHAVAMGPKHFASLLHAIERAHAKVCADPEDMQPLSPPECEAYLQPDNVRPFSLKHAKQQASIVGHMRQAGLLQNPKSTYIEFGAGKGYLSSMLADASDAKQFILLDMRSFRMKADRSLKKVQDVQLARLNVDIKDFQPAGVPELHGGAAPWVCMGKHLCGAATDFTLRCCASSLHAVKSSSELDQPADHRQPEADSCIRQSAAPNADDASDHHHTSTRDSTMQTAAAATTTAIPEHANGTDVNKVLAATATRTNSCADRDSSRASQSAAEQAGSQNDGHACTGRRGVQGLAVATCCHHRCSWQHYVGKASFRDLGFSPEGFEVMSWMTGWALCGHETPNVEDELGQIPTGAEMTSNKDAMVDQHTDPACTVPSDRSSEVQMGIADSPEALPDDHITDLSRSVRMQLGQKCKKLIDHGRHQYLAAQGFQVKSVLYISPDVSGENRLLTASL